MHQRALLWISAASFTLVSLPHGALAEPRHPRAAAVSKKHAPPETSRVFNAETQSLLKMAFEEEKAGHTDKALDLFQQAFAEAKSSATEAELGLAELRAGQYVMAARHLSNCLKFYQVPVLARSENYILDKLDEAKKHVGTLNVRVNVPKATVTVDGEVVREWPFHDQIFVEPGAHEVKVTRLGYWMSHTEVPIEAGQTKEVSFALQERERESVYNVRKPMDLNVNGVGGEKEPGWTKPLLVGSSVGLAVAVGTLVFGLMNKSTANDEWASYNAAYLDANSTCSTAGQAAECIKQRDDAAARRDVWNTVAIVGGIGAGVSLAGLIIGIVSRPSTPTQITLQPVIGKNDLGGAVVGRF